MRFKYSSNDIAAQVTFEIFSVAIENRVTLNIPESLEEDMFS